VETQIREDKILEFKALVVTKHIYDQMRIAGPHGAEEVRFIGWVQMVDEWYVGESHGTLVRVRRMDMMEYMSKKLGGADRVTNEAQESNMGKFAFLNKELEAYRNSLPQIFLK